MFPIICTLISNYSYFGPLDVGIRESQYDSHTKQYYTTPNVINIWIDQTWYITHKLKSKQMINISGKLKPKYTVKTNKKPIRAIWTYDV